MLTINQRPSPNFWTYNLGFEAVCNHGTASGNGEAGALTAEDWLRNPAAQASANYMVWQDGTIDCLVDPYRGYSAWANGIVNNPDLGNPLIKRWLAAGINPNTKTISIEHVAASAAMIAHQTMPAAQQQASQQLILQLCRDFHIPVQRVNIVGHYQFDSVSRANCPGVINLDRYVQQLQQLQAGQGEISLNGHTIRGEILRYWRLLFNPLVVLGFPLTEEFVDADGRTTQVYERGVLKFYPGNIGSDWVVIGELVGRAAAPAGVIAAQQPTVSGPIKNYCSRLWNSLVVLGNPISNQFVDADGRTAQYFERAKLRIYPEFAGSDWEVQGERLGAAWLTSHQLPAVVA